MLQHRFQLRRSVKEGATLTIGENAFVVAIERLIKLNCSDNARSNYFYNF